MSKHTIWLFSLLFGAAACKADYLQVGEDQLGSHDGGDATTVADVAPAGTGGVGGVGGGLGGVGGGAGGGTSTGGLGGSSAMVAVCGDGILQGDEQCDDGNTLSFDGCNALCQVEVDFRCDSPARPCSYLGRCGDGVVTSDEVCDDGNVVTGDGCSADCQRIDRGWTCPVAGKPCTPLCGDGLIVGYESCDDGNSLSGDGCSLTCTIEPGAACPGPGVPCVRSVCGNGVVDPGEQCDCGVDLTHAPAGCKGANGVLYGDGSGCSTTCTREPICLDASGKVAPCTPICGDGNRDNGEDCDDGNRVDGDGCSSTCKLEVGFTCRSVASRVGGSSQRSECVPTCGDGIVVAGEACDDGASNSDAYGGCTTLCLPGPYCGDGVVSGPEECDDGADNGKNLGTNGCTVACTRVHFCGDGLSDGYMGEECDLGAENGKPGARCTRDCRVVL